MQADTVIEVLNLDLLRFNNPVLVTVPQEDVLIHESESMQAIMVSRGNGEYKLVQSGERIKEILYKAFLHRFEANFRAFHEGVLASRDSNENSEPPFSAPSA